MPLTVLVVSCHGADRAVEPAGSVPSAVPVPPASPTASAAPALPAGPLLEALAPLADVPMARLAIRGVSPDQVVERAEALALELWVEGTGVEAPLRVAVLLDAGAPRFLAPSEKLPVSALVPADRDLAEGGHRLVALLTYPSGELARADGAVVFAATTFFVSRKSAPPALPRVVLVQPFGTYNGPEAAGAAVLSCFVDGSAVGEVTASIRGAGTETTAAIAPGRAYALRELASGDYQVALDLDVGGAAIAAERTITVNLDAPRPD